MGGIRNILISPTTANLLNNLDKDKKQEEFRRGGGLPESSALDRVKEFLPEIKKSNESTLKSMEDVGEEDKHIEMNIYKPSI